MEKKDVPRQSSIKYGAAPSANKRKPTDADVTNSFQTPDKANKKRKVGKTKNKRIDSVKKYDENEKAFVNELQGVKMITEGEGDEEEDTKSKMKPGRRRLRQRAVAEEDEDSDVNLPMDTSKRKEKVTDTSSRPLSSERAKVQGDNRKVKATYPAVKTFCGQRADLEKNPEMAKELVNADEIDQLKTNKAKKANNEAKRNEKACIKDTAVTVVETQTSFFTATSSQKLKAKSTVVDDLEISKTLNKLKPDDVAEKNTGLRIESREVPYFELAHLFANIEEVTGRLVIQDLLTAFFRDVILRSPNDLLACLYLCVCVDLAPPFENLKIGIGDAILMKAISEATGAGLKFIKGMYHKEGDLGKVAQKARSKQQTLSFTSSKSAAWNESGLTVQHVHQQFVKIAKMAGSNSQQQKCSIIKGLLVKCEKEKKDKGALSAEGAKYIIRGLQGKLRIGLAEKSILMGVAYAFMTDKEYNDKEKQQEALNSVKKAFAECPSYNALVAAFYDVQKTSSSAPFLCVNNFKQVAEKCTLTPGTPVSPMLARPTKAYAMVFDRFEGKPFTCEYKYDGERAQIHILSDGKIAIFSRNFENSTERFPDVKLAISSAAKKTLVSNCIVDAEVVAIDRSTNKRLPFQILSTRSRKNVKVEDIKVPICIYAFDLLYLNNVSLLGVSLAQRREKLRELFEVHPGTFEFATSLDVKDCVNVKNNSEAMEEAVDKVRNFLEEAVRENCEGLMVKTLEKEATYEPANRSHKWLKLKKDYLDGIGDSADLVPIGAFYGRGKRTGVYGAYLLACYDPDTEMYQPITKLGTGLSDDVLKKFYDLLKEKVVNKPPTDYAIGEGIKPDVWFEAKYVWEILGADLSISPKYTAAMGLVAKDKGISLRFPRFLRIRDDKNSTHATTSVQIADLYRAQGITSVVNVEEEDDDMLI